LVISVLRVSVIPFLAAVLAWLAWEYFVPLQPDLSDAPTARRVDKKALSPPDRAG